MRALVGVNSNPLTWIAGSPSPHVQDVRLWMASLREYSLLLTDLSRRELLRALSIDGNNETLVSILVDFISEQPKANSDIVMSADFLIGNRDPYSQIDSVLSTEIMCVAKERSREFPEGMKTIDAYRQTIGTFIKFVKKVTIVDPYAGASMVSKNPKRSWLIRQLFDEGVSEVHIVTTVPDNRETQGLNASERLEKLMNAQTRLGGEAKRKGSRLTLEPYLPNPKFHNRRISFDFGEGSLYFSMEKGIDGFQPGEVDPGSNITEVTPEGYATYLRSIRSILQRPEQ